MHKQKHLVEVSMENTFSAITISMYFETNSCMPSIEFTRRLHGNPVNIQKHALFKFAQGIGKYIKQIPHLSSLLVGDTLYQKLVCTSPKLYKPDNIIVVSKKKSLWVVPRVVNHPNSSHKIHDLLRASVVKIVSALVSSITVHPF